MNDRLMALLSCDPTYSLLAELRHDVPIDDIHFAICLGSERYKGRVTMLIAAKSHVY